MRGRQRRKALEEEAAEKEEAERARLARAGKILRRRESIRDQYLQQLPPEPTEEDEEVHHVSASYKPTFPSILQYYGLESLVSRALIA